MSGGQGGWGDSVRFSFSGRKAPGASHTFGTFTSNKKTNFFNKSDKAGCERAFASAMLSLRDRALKEGGDAVIDIHSVYRSEEHTSELQSLMRISYAVFCLKKKKIKHIRIKLHEHRCI